MRSYTVAFDQNASSLEPKHPHRGFGLAAYLRGQGYDVYFNGQVGPHRLRRFFTRHPESWLPMVVGLPWTRRFSAVICDSAVGSLQTELISRLPGQWPATIFIALTNPNPEGPRWKASVRRRILETAIRRADAVVHALKELGDSFARERWCEPERLFYAPTCVDIDFFDPARAREVDPPDGLTRSSFLLAVGDSSRDDTFLYAALRDCRMPIVRVTRDMSVVQRVKPLMRAGRSDLILSQTSFAELRWLYVNCAVAIFTSRLDQWQAAGSTALTEAMACGAPCVAVGGGCLEREWRYLASRAGLECPVLFYGEGQPGELRAAVHEALDARIDAGRGERSREMALRAFPIEVAYRAITAALRRALQRRLRDCYSTQPVGGDPDRDFSRQPTIQ